MSIKARDLRNALTSLPPIEALTGGQPAKKDRVLSAFSQADRTLGNGVRVVGRVGLHGSERWQVGNSNPTSLTQRYPLKGIPRVAMRLKWKPTSGSFPFLRVLAVPAGPTQKLNGFGTYVADAPGGMLKVEVHYVGTDIEDKLWLIQLDTSGETWNAEKTDPGSAWSSLKRYEVDLRPDNIKDPDVMRVWSHMSSIEVTLSYIGGARVVSACVQERPWGYARSTSEYWLSAMATDANGEVVKNLPVNYPVTRKTVSDPSYGSSRLYGVVRQQHVELGPVLMSHSTWDESTQPVNATDTASITTGSTTWVDMLRPTLTEWNAGSPGWSLSAGGCAQQYHYSNAARELRGVNAAVPVRLRVYGKCVGTGSGHIRLQSEAFSMADMVVSATAQWREVSGVLRCGVAAEDPSTAMLFGRVDFGGDVLHIQHVVLEYLKQ